MSSALPPFKPTSEPLIPFENLEGQQGPYIADPALVHAANTALALQMPLLLTGEPGCGKSDFAWVAAHALGHENGPLRFYVRSDTRARDLLYHYDALRRFGDAQHGDEEKAEARDPRNYISLRALGIALMSGDSKRPVVLVDEIDKAPRDLPNDLLHEMDEGWFEIPEIGDSVGAQPESKSNPAKIELRREMKRPINPKTGAPMPKPLVIITSNAERQLPEAFLRRCIYYPISMPKEEQLTRIAEARFKQDGDPKLEMLQGMVKIFVAFRENQLAKKPTTAEMLNWIEALGRHYDFNHVQPTLKIFIQRIEAQEDPKWHELPGLGCLLKMAEDVKAVAPPDEST